MGTVSISCTAQGGRLRIANNAVTYTPRANVGGIADSFYYQAATVLGGTLRQKVTVNIGALNGLPDARDDLGNAAVAGHPPSAITRRSPPPMGWSASGVITPCPNTG